MITVENSAIYRAKALETRRQNKLDRIEAERIKALPPPIPVQIAPPPSHIEIRLQRVRSQLDLIDSLIAKERDARNLDRLAAASAKLSEQERLLSDRPLPGSRRPATIRRSRVGSAGLMPE